MTRKPLVSIVVPIYNTAQYVEKCLKSILRSSLTDIEVICVDDCSTDQSIRIVQRIAEKDPRVKIIRHKKNLGLGGARNTGIAAAQAEYVGGVDSDDWIAPSMYESLLRATDDGIVDVVEGGFEKVNSAGKVLSSYIPEALRSVNDANQINIFEATRPSFCSKLWKRALFTENNIWFPEHMYYEDMVTTPRLLAKAQEIAFINEAPYKYLQREGSITFSFSSKHQFDYFKGFDIILNFLIENNLLERYQKDFELQALNRLKHHVKTCADAELPEIEKQAYLKLLFMLSSGYLENYERLNGVSSNFLRELFEKGACLNASTQTDLIREKIKIINKDLESTKAMVEKQKGLISAVAHKLAEERERRRAKKYRTISAVVILINFILCLLLFVSWSGLN